MEMKKTAKQKLQNNEGVCCLSLQFKITSAVWKICICLNGHLRHVMTLLWSGKGKWQKKKSCVNRKQCSYICTNPTWEGFARLHTLIVMMSSRIHISLTNSSGTFVVCFSRKFELENKKFSHRLGLSPSIHQS